TLRKLDQIASHAKHGLIVQLLEDNSPTGQHSTDNDVLDAGSDSHLENQHVRYQQWQTALSARNIGLVNN
ncbi:MAG TPA: DUF2868 domain-containing protein, partial [Psychrobacter sp.]|nr:DUF2868 domain-containing protein [Psychrobacter sp.]